MKVMANRFFAILLITAFIFPASAGAFENPNALGPSWAIPNDSERGQHIFSFVDMYGEPSSNLYSGSMVDMPTENPLCTTISDANCANGYNYYAILPQCLSPSDINCISDFGITDSQNNNSSGKFQRYFPNTALNKFQGSASLGVPDGGTGSVYTVAGADFGNGNQYFVRVIAEGHGNSQSSALTNLDLQVFPVNYRDVNYPPAWGDAGLTPILNPTTGKSNWLWSAPGLIDNVFCVANSTKEGKCLQRYEFPSHMRFFLKVRMNKVPSGWMHGRISQPNISISKENSAVTLSFSGEPVSVPVVFKTYWWTQMPAELQSQYDTKTGCYIKNPALQSPSGCRASGRTGPSEDPLQRNVIVRPDAWSVLGMEQLKLVLPFVNDQATTQLSTWAVRTLSSGEMAGADKCFADTSRITGMVSTNATQYSAGPPVFDKSSQSLVYQVGAPHFTNKNTVFEGSYDLSIPSDVARCIYGFSNAPIKAEISIVAPDGTNKVATTSLVEKDGWLFFSANGFTFSNPTIQVKLFQEAVKATPTPSPTPTETPIATPTPTSTATKAPVVAKKVTITCIKGKSVKKVTAIKPLCPSGYKKK